MSSEPTPTLERILDPDEATRRCLDLFETDPVRSNMAAAALAHGQATEVLRVHDEDRTLGVAALRGTTWTLTGLDQLAIAPLADALVGSPQKLFGEVADTFALAARSSDANGGGFDVGEVFRFRVLRRLRTPGVPGALSAADPNDAERLAGWMSAFDADIGHPSATDHTPNVRAAIAAGRFWTWHHGDDIVACAQTTKPAAGAVRIGGVYAPPEHRRRGYAAGLTAAISENQLRRADVGTVLLNTQAGNAATNRLYGRLGFEHVFNAVEVTLRSRH